MKKYRFVMIGTGFWSRFQLAGWRELPNVECVAVYNRTRSKAEALAEAFGVPRVYEDPAAMLDRERPDFADILTGEETHEVFTLMAARRGLPVVCQKPVAPDLAAARRMRDACREAGVPLLINENWRWQRPLRALKAKMDSGIIGAPWRARVVYNSSFPVFDNQPALKEQKRFLLMDVGVHLLDTVRFLFGEIETVFCRTHRVNAAIRGEDAASLLLTMKNGMTVSLELSYASRWSGECFPQTLCLVEGEDASLELLQDYRLRLTTRAGVEEHTHPPPAYEWLDPAYAVVHASIVDCQRNLLLGMEDETKVETRADDNLLTFEAVEAAYQSAASATPVPPADFR